MAEPIRETTQTTTQVGNTVQSTEQVVDHQAAKAHHQNVASRVIWFVAGVIITLLGIRFVLALLGANLGNGFADFIFSASNPFVSPFFNLFSYDLETGVSRVEIFTLVAMAVYALVAFGIARLATITRDR